MLAALELHTASRVLIARWTGADATALPFGLLRARCPCAVCRRRGPAAAAVDVVELIACGPAAVQIRFSDGHARGIYPFAYLRELADELRRGTAPAA